jgi:hypothetical protein
MSTKSVLAILCVVLLIAPMPYSFAQQPQPMNQPVPAGGSQGQPQPILSADQLDSLVAPLALYPDPILSQVLVASTYPLEIAEAAQWLGQNSSLSGKALADAAAKQPWDASVQALVMFPDLLKRLSQDISWTSDLGNVFLAQQDGVMQAIQRMRLRAQQKGMLQSNSQQTVSTTMDNGQSYIVIEPASPQVVYVPQYDPAAIWGPPLYYPYPAIYYPPAASFISFGLGFAVGAFWGGGWGGWGWGAGWGHNNVVINNNFISSNHFNRVNVANGNNWLHNPAHRGGVPYTNPAVANRYQGGRGNVNPRPTVGQAQQHLNQGNTGRGNAGLGAGSANRFGPDPGKPTPGGDRSGPSNPSQGSANRIAPSPPPQGGVAPGNSAIRGGANRMAPMGGGGVNRGAPGGNRGFSGGGRMHGGGGGRRR